MLYLYFNFFLMTWSQMLLPTPYEQFHTICCYVLKIVRTAFAKAFVTVALMPSIYFLFLPYFPDHFTMLIIIPTFIWWHISLSSFSTIFNEIWKKVELHAEEYIKALHIALLNWYLHQAGQERSYHGQHMPVVAVKFMEERITKWNDLFIQEYINCKHH